MGLPLSYSGCSRVTGDYEGAHTGAWGSETYDALEQFGSRENLEERLLHNPADARIDRKVLDYLREHAGDCHLQAGCLGLYVIVCFVVAARLEWLDGGELPGKSYAHEEKRCNREPLTRRGHFSVRRDEYRARDDAVPASR